jgi:predicted RNA-binding protein
MTVTRIKTNQVDIKKVRAALSRLSDSQQALSALSDMVIHDPKNEHLQGLLSVLARDLKSVDYELDELIPMDW